MTYKIEKNIPVATQGRRRTEERVHFNNLPLTKMKKGDSVLLLSKPGKYSASGLSTKFTKFCRENNLSRKDFKVGKYKGTLRIWKL